MLETTVTILVFLLVMVLAAIVFALWAVGVVVRFLFNAIRGVGRVVTGGATGDAIVVKKVKLVACKNPQCGQRNPIEARFCRRCGSAMAPATRVTVRRAAML